MSHPELLLARAVAGLGGSTLTPTPRTPGRPGPEVGPEEGRALARLLEAELSQWAGIVRRQARTGDGPTK